jgi:hypothetical protein
MTVIDGGLTEVSVVVFCPLPIPLLASNENASPPAGSVRPWVKVTPVS